MIRRFWCKSCKLEIVNPTAQEISDHIDGHVKKNLLEDLTP